MKTLVLTLCVGLVVVSDAVADDLADLQGTWRVMASSTNDKFATDANVRKTDLRLTFTGHTFLLRQGVTRYGRFSIKLDESASPKRIDLTAAGGTMKSIYELNGDELKICWPENPKTSPAPKDFKTGFYYLCRRERPAKDLPKLEGAWTARLMRDPGENGLLLGERLEQRGIRFVFAGDTLFMHEAGKPTTVFRFRLDATQPDNLPLRRITLFGASVFDIAYEYDGETLFVFFPGKDDGDNAPKDKDTSSVRILLGREGKKTAQSLEGNWAVVSILENGERLLPEHLKQLTRQFNFQDDKCTWLSDPKTTETSFITDVSKTPAEIDFAVNKTEVYAIYEQSGDVLRICFPGDFINHPQDRPKDFETGGQTFVLLRGKPQTDAAPSRTNIKTKTPAKK